MATKIFLVEKVELISIEKLKGWENNPRLNDAAVPSVARSIETYGMLVPILVNKKNEVLAGNTRLKACQVLGLEKVPCVRAEHLTKDQQTAYNVADNKLHEIATWDQDTLREIFTQLQAKFENTFDYSLLGYQNAEVELILNGWNSNAQRLGDIKSDDSPALAKIVVKCGREDEERVRVLIQESLNAANIEGVEVS